MNIENLSVRKSDLLRAIIREFVETALPVGSATLAERHGFDISPATIRNEMSELEAMGLIEQPHTSAGRIPTESGFRIFVNQALSDYESADKKPLRQKMKIAAIGNDPESAVKSIAKQVAAEAREAVVVAFSPRHVYYTGLSHLFSQPEFREFGRVVRFGELIDRLDEIMEAALDRVRPDIAVWIGSENPFGNSCGTVIAGCRTSPSSHGAFGVLGPLRMDYERSIALVDTARSALDELANRNQ
jgi:heat-inducible transcriptional repressor